MAILRLAAWLPNWLWLAGGKVRPERITEAKGGVALTLAISFMALWVLFAVHGKFLTRNST